VDWQKYEYLYDHPVEVAIGFDTNGELKFALTEQDRTCVTIPNETWALVAGGTVIHNHPSGNCLGTRDIEAGIRHNVPTMIVVGTYEGRQYRYTVHMSDEVLAYYREDLTRYWSDTGFAKYEIERTIPEIAERKAALYDDVNDPVLDFIFFDALWVEFARQLYEEGIDGFVYIKEEV